MKILVIDTMPYHHHKWYKSRTQYINSSNTGCLCATLSKKNGNNNLKMIVSRTAKIKLSNHSGCTIFKIQLTWTMRSFRRFLYTWSSWWWLTVKSSLDAASFMELITSSWAWRTLIREAFSCIEYSLQQTISCATKHKLALCLQLIKTQNNTVYFTLWNKISLRN